MMLTPTVGSCSALRKSLRTAAAGDSARVALDNCAAADCLNNHGCGRSKCCTNSTSARSAARHLTRVVVLLKLQLLAHRTAKALPVFTNTEKSVCQSSMQKPFAVAKKIHLLQKKKMSSNNNQNGKGSGMTDDWRLKVNLGTAVNTGNMVETGQSGGVAVDFSTGSISKAQKDILDLWDAKLKHVSRLESKLQCLDVLKAKIHKLERLLELTNGDSGLKDLALDPPSEEDSVDMDREGCSNEDSLMASAQEEQIAPQTIRST